MIQIVSLLVSDTSNGIMVLIFLYANYRSRNALTLALYFGIMIAV